MSSNVVTESSVNLLKECDAGVKMAVKNLDDILEHVSDEKLKDVLEHSRKRHIELKNEIEKFGGKVTDSVSSKTTYLINNDIDSTSNKNKTAKSLGIPIITEEQFKELLN